uniref:Synaptobrevin, longin-like domain protein n=1 Tax=Tanacetum cinerariifolium TaxID=118510 RepID=A0A6L2JJ37_TANCI|nr:hypothetical protein [Tanacetum cinerariifolium]
MSTPTFAKTHNLIAYLAKPTESEGFKQIIDFLNGSSVSYALIASPTIRTSCIKQFWTIEKVKTINDEVRIQALIDEKRVNIKESSIRRTLKLDDAEGTSFFTNAEIFDGLAKMGYEKLSEKLTFYKAFFSPQCTMASTIICLATNQKFNFSRYILLSLVKNIEAGVPFFMFPRFVQLLIDHQLVTALFDNMLVLATNEVGIIQDDVQSITIPTEPSTSKPYKKHKTKKQQTQAPKVPSPEPSPEHKLPSPSNDPLPGGKDSIKLKELMDLCTHLSNKVLELERGERVLKDLHSVHSKVDNVVPVVEKEKSFKQERIIADLDEDVEINLEEAQAKPYRMDLKHQEKVLSMQDVDDEEPGEVEEVIKVVKAAKLMTEVVTTAEATKVSVPRRRRGVVIKDPKETTSIVVIHSEVQSKDKGKVMKYQGLKRKPLTEAQARKNMIIYLKNMAGFKMNYFKRMTYSEIRPLFEKHYNYNQAFLKEVNEEVTVPEKEVEIVSNDDDDDVYTEATPLVSKIPIVDYKIHFERNKPYFKIIRADGNHMLFLSFSTLLKIFVRVFGACQRKPNVEASIWRDQKGRYGLAKRYPLTHFTLEQMMSNVRLEVKEESEMSLELLRLVRRQLNKGGGLLGIMDFNILLLLFILSVAAWNYCCLLSDFVTILYYFPKGVICHEKVLFYPHQPDIIFSWIEDRNFCSHYCSSSSLHCIDQVDMDCIFLFKASPLALIPLVDPN